MPTVSDPVTVAPAPTLRLELRVVAPLTPSVPPSVVAPEFTENAPPPDNATLPPTVSEPEREVAVTGTVRVLTLTSPRVIAPDVINRYVAVPMRALIRVVA